MRSIEAVVRVFALITPLNVLLSVTHPFETVTSSFSIGTIPSHSSARTAAAAISASLRSAVLNSLTYDVEDLVLLHEEMLVTVQVDVGIPYLARPSSPSTRRI
jgi:hypothetical protein